MTKTVEKIYGAQGLTELILLKMTIFPREIYRFSAISIKIPMTFYTELEQIILKLKGKEKRP